MKSNILIYCLLISLVVACQENSKKIEKTANIQVTQNIKDSVLIKEVICDGSEYKFQLPIFESTESVNKRLTKDIITLINSNPEVDIINAYGEFLKNRKEQLCTQPNDGIQHLVVNHISQNESFISYQLDYLKDNEQGSLLKSFSKKDMQPIHLAALIKPGKENDVATIYNINLQQEVASLGLKVKPEDQDAFQSFIKEAIFTFNPSEFESIDTGLRKDHNGSVALQVGKKINLPAKFSYLNQYIIIDILAVELNTYLDFSKI